MQAESPSRRDGQVPLTGRELDVLRRIARGATLAEIATAEGVSRASVQNRLERAERKLAARNRVHAVALAVQRGLIDPLE